AAPPDRIHARLRDREVEPGELERAGESQAVGQRRRDRPGLLYPGRDPRVTVRALEVDVVALAALERQVDEGAAPGPGGDDDRVGAELVERMHVRAGADLDAGVS